MADEEHTTIRIETGGGPIDVWEFSYFLRLFDAAYAVACERLLALGTAQPSGAKDLFLFVEKLRQALSVSDVPPRRLSRRRKPEPLNLAILDIRSNSAIEIVFGGVTVALGAAVMACGGEFKGSGSQAKLPPLATAIVTLRGRFRRN